MRLLEPGKNSIAFKGGLVLFYFILLGSQLSYKFYRYANFPTRTVKTAHWKHNLNESFRGQGISILNYGKCAALSLDKRYEFKHTLAILPLGLSLQVEYIEQTKRVRFAYWNPISAYYAIQPFRGPPSI